MTAASTAEAFAAPGDWPEIESLAVELATVAGAEIIAALGRRVMVRYKGAPDSDRDPVSEVDQRVETLIRERVAERFPTHRVVGEEFAPAELPAADGRGPDIAWIVDPIDGTNNFINGFPWFCASIGVALDGVPVVGAVWCATSHALRAGVYHAGHGGTLRFDGQPVVAPDAPHVRRRLAGDPGSGSGSRWASRWDLRKTGSAAMECVCVAAGMLQVARFEQPFAWDVAGGIALLRAAGRDVLVQEGDGWAPFGGFAGADGGRFDRDWRRALVIGDADGLVTRTRP